MLKRVSAGLLLYRYSTTLEVLLVHPGGPFWAKKDFGAWSIPKGEVAESEDRLEAAKREFAEETGCTIDGDFRPLASIRQRSGKVVYAWAIEGDCDPAQLRSNRFTMEWPPTSGRMQQFPEVDRAAWFTLDEARKRIIPGQVGFIDELASLLGVGSKPTA